MCDICESKYSDANYQPKFIHNSLQSFEKIRKSLVQ